VALAALAFAAVASAGGRSYTVHMTRDGQAAARAALLTTSDLGSGWTGGARKPDLFTNLRCSNYHPKLSDLVIVGAASVRYRQPGLEVSSDSQVFRSERMVQKDWRRTAEAPHFVSCLRAAARKAANGRKSRFVAFRKLPVPAIGTNTAAFRTIFDVSTKQGKVRLAVDIIGFTRGTTELTLTTTMALASVPTLAANEIVLARTLLTRVRV
jgi:hypothetical protein